MRVSVVNSLDGIVNVPSKGTFIIEQLYNGSRLYTKGIDRYSIFDDKSANSLCEMKRSNQQPVFQLFKTIFVNETCIEMHID